MAKGYTGAPSKTEVEAEAETEMGDNTEPFRFLDLPYEIRLEIYELLLQSPDPIYVSPACRQLNLHVQLKNCGKIFGEARGDYFLPKAIRLTDRRPHINLLRACKQTNGEGTPILYGQNRFVVGSESILSIVPVCFITNVAFSG